MKMIQTTEIPAVTRAFAALLALSLIAAPAAFAQSAYRPVLAAGSPHAIADNGTTRTLTMSRGSGERIAEYVSFNIAAGYTYEIDTAGWFATLHRVNNTDNPSTIAGTLRSINSAATAIYLVNPAGIVFSKTAVVDVPALVASTLDVDSSFDHNGTSIFRANTTSPGDITIESGAQIIAPGFAYFIANSIDYQGGTIQSPNIFMGAFGAMAGGGVETLTTAKGATITLDLTSFVPSGSAGAGRIVLEGDFNGVSTGAIKAVASENIMVSNSIRNIKNVILEATQDVIMQEDSRISADTITLDSGANVQLNQDSMISGTGTITLDAGSAIHMGQNTMLNANDGGAVALDAGTTISMEQDARVEAELDISMKSGGNMTLQEVQSSKGSIRLVSTNGHIQLKEDVQAKKGDIEMTAGNSIQAVDVTRVVEASNLTAKAGSDILLYHTLVQHVAATSTTGHIVMTNDAAVNILGLSARSNITVATHAGDISVAGGILSSQGGVSLHAQAADGSVVMRNGSSITGQSVSVFAGNNVVLQDVHATARGNGILVTASNGWILVSNNAVLRSADDLGLRAGDSITFGTNAMALAGGAVRLDAATNITMESGSGITGRSVKATAGQNIALQRVAATNRDVTVHATNGSIMVLHEIRANRDIAMQAGLDITIASTGALIASDGSRRPLQSRTGNNVDLTAGRNIHMQGDSAIYTHSRGDVTVNAGEWIVLQEVTANRGDIFARSTNSSITLRDDVDAWGAIRLRAEDDIEVERGVSVEAGTQIRMISREDIDIGRSAALTAGTGVELDARDDITIRRDASIYTQRGDVGLDAGDDITVNRDASIEARRGNVELDARNNITLNNDVTVSAGRDIEMTAARRNLTVGADATLTADRNIRLEAGRDVSLEQNAEANAGRNIVVDAGDDVTLAAGAEMNARRNIRITAEEDLTLESGRNGRDPSSIAAGRDLMAEVGGDITLEENTDMVAGRDVELAAGDDIVMGEDTAIRARRDVALTAEDDITLAQDAAIRARRDVELTAGDDLTLESGRNGRNPSSITAGNDAILVSEAGDIELERNTSVMAGNDAVLTAEEGDIDLNRAASVVATHDATLTASDAITLGREASVIAGEGDATLIASTGDIELGRDASVVAEEGDALLDAGNDVVMDDMGSMVGGGVNATVIAGNDAFINNVIAEIGDATITAEAGRVDITGFVVAGEDIFVTAGKDIEMEDGSLLYAGDDIDLTAGGHILSDSDIIANDLTTTSGTYTELTKTDVDSLRAQAGDTITLENFGDLNILNALAENDIWINSLTGSLAVTGPMTSKRADVTLGAAVDITGRGRISGRQLNLTAGRDVDVVSRVRRLNVEALGRNLKVDNDSSNLDVIQGAAPNGSFRVRNTGNLRVTADIMARNNLVMQSLYGDFTNIGTLTGDNVTLQADAGRITQNAAVSASSVLAVLAQNDITVNAAASGGDTVLRSSGGNVLLNAPVAARNDLAVVAKRYIIGSGSGQVDVSGGNIILKAPWGIKGRDDTALVLSASGVYTVSTFGPFKVNARNGRRVNAQQMNFTHATFDGVGRLVIDVDSDFPREAYDAVWKIRNAMAYLQVIPMLRHGFKDYAHMVFFQTLYPWPWVEDSVSTVQYIKLRRATLQWLEEAEADEAAFRQQVWAPQHH